MFHALQEDELAKMESELGAMQQELAQVQKEREILEGQRRVLKAVAAPAVARQERVDRDRAEPPPACAQSQV